MYKHIRLIKITCKESFVLDGGSFPILEGEQFESIDDNYDYFRGISTRSIYGKDQELHFSNEVLMKYFTFSNVRQEPIKVN